jgi:hypothetical protein
LAAGTYAWFAPAATFSAIAGVMPKLSNCSVRALTGLAEQRGALFEPKARPLSLGPIKMKWV